MNQSLYGFIAGFVGALVLIAIMYLMLVAELSGTPGFVGIYRVMFGRNVSMDHILGATGFALAGGIWG